MYTHPIYVCTGAELDVTSNKWHDADGMTVTVSGEYEMEPYWDDAANSLQVNPHCVITVYEHHQLSGASEEYRGPTVQKISMDNQVSSYRCTCR